MKTKIIVDSTIDVTEDIKKRLTVVPLTVRFGESEYIDGVTLTREDFYKKLLESDVLPTTSQATPIAFAQEFKEIVKDGGSAVVITISSTLSGTYQSAVIAAEDYPDNIFVVDSKTTTIGAGVLAERALELANEGLEAKEIAKILTKEREKVSIIALLDTLEYLKRGGRISKTVAFAGELLSIKPVITLKDGEIKILGKARGQKQGNKLLTEEIENLGGIDFSRPVLFGYTGLEIKMLDKYIASNSDMWEEGLEEIRSSLIGSIVGTHVGPGAIAIAFFEK